MWRETREVVTPNETLAWSGVVRGVCMRSYYSYIVSSVDSLVFPINHSLLPGRVGYPLGQCDGEEGRVMMRGLALRSNPQTNSC